MDSENCTKSHNTDKATLFTIGSEEKVLEDAHSDKLFCSIVSAAVAGVIRHSMESAGRFREQCYELLQVTSTKDAERELEKRLMNITKGEGIKQDAKQSQQTNTDELWLDRSSLDWDTMTGEQNSGFTDGWLNQALAEAEDWS